MAVTFEATILNSSSDHPALIWASRVQQSFVRSWSEPLEILSDSLALIRTHRTCPPEHCFSDWHLLGSTSCKQCCFQRADGILYRHICTTYFYDKDSSVMNRSQRRNQS